LEQPKCFTKSSAEYTEAHMGNRIKLEFKLEISLETISGWIKKRRF